MDDATLVARARAGDGEAFGQLVNRYRRSAYLVALSVIGRPEDAEDATQEAFLAALERLDDCRNPSRFGGWLMTIVRNRSSNLVRREALRATDPIPFSASSKGPTPEKDAQLSELRDEIARALGELPEAHREVVLLHDLEGWKHREIAQRLGLPAGTVRSHLHYARKSLRGILRPDAEREGDPGRSGPSSKRQRKTDETDE